MSKIKTAGQSYINGLKEDGFKGYFRERKALYICLGIMFIPWCLDMWASVHGFDDVIKWTRWRLENALELYIGYRILSFIIRRWRFGKELDDLKKAEKTTEYQEWFNSLSPEEKLVELKKKDILIQEQTLKTSKTQTAMGAAGLAQGHKIVKAVKAPKKITATIKPND